MHARQQFADKAVGLGERDGQLAARNLATRVERAVRFGAVPLEGASDVHLELADLKAAAAGLPQQHVTLGGRGAVCDELDGRIAGERAGRCGWKKRESGRL